MKRYAYIVWLLPVFAACDRAPYPGYKTVASDVHLKLLKLGDGDPTPLSGDSVLLRWRAGQWQGETGSLMSSERWYAVDDLDMALFEAVLPDLHVDDSVSVITRARHVPWTVLFPDAAAEVNDTTMVRVELSVRSLLTASAQKERREARRRADPEGYEARLVRAFLDTASSRWTRWGTSELYYWIDTGQTGGDSIQNGDQVAIQYEGRSLEDGRVFDDTWHGGQPLVYRVGDPDQVIEGLAVAVSLLMSGWSGAFVIPSSMAFGERGVSKLLPPYVPVLYRVRVEKVGPGASGA